MRTFVFVLIAVASGAALTGCQTSPPGLDRALNVQHLPASPGEAPIHDPSKSAGLDLRFGDSKFGLDCTTDTVGDHMRGTTALICSWSNSAPVSNES